MLAYTLMFSLIFRMFKSDLPLSKVGRELLMLYFIVLLSGNPCHYFLLLFCFVKAVNNSITVVLKVVFSVYFLISSVLLYGINNIVLSYSTKYLGTV